MGILTKRAYKKGLKGPSSKKFGKMVMKESKRKTKQLIRNQDRRGRILQGPQGGQWTAGPKSRDIPNQQIENCGWLRKRKKKK